MTTKVTHLPVAQIRWRTPGVDPLAQVLRARACARRTMNDSRSAPYGQTQPQKNPRPQMTRVTAIEIQSMKMSGSERKISFGNSSLRSEPKNVKICVVLGWALKTNPEATRREQRRSCGERACGVASCAL